MKMYLLFIVFETLFCFFSQSLTENQLQSNSVSLIEWNETSPRKKLKTVKQLSQPNKTEDNIFLSILRKRATLETIFIFYWQHWEYFYFQIQKLILFQHGNGKHSSTWWITQPMKKSNGFSFHCSSRMVFTLSSVFSFSQ